MSTASILKSKPFLFCLIFGSFIALLGFGSDSLHDALRFDRHAIEQGEIWRIFTAHLVHLSTTHLLMNLAGLLMVFYFFGSCLTVTKWILVVLLSMPIISIGIYYFNPTIFWYVGLSGVLHALFIAGGLADLAVRKIEGILFLSLISAKILWEQVVGPLPGSEETAGGPVLVDAHFYGAISGLLIFMLIWGLEKRRQIEN